jgi:lipid II:glycine glycyltransferase (peptidoglycan interpeptide bridge formation enzyme)
VLQQEGFERRPAAEGGRTLFVDLNDSLEDLRANLNKKWRYQLRQAEKSNLSLLEAPNGELFDIFLRVYREMMQRKKFITYVDVNEFSLMQQDLDESAKMKILVCHSKGVVHAAVVCAALGNTGIYVLGATSAEGLKSCGSHFLQWKMIEWLKSRGYRWYDLGGYDPIGVPGTAHFKRGLAGKKGMDCKRIGQFDACPNRILKIAVRQFDSLRIRSRRLKRRFNSFRNKTVILAGRMNILSKSHQ